MEAGVLLAHGALPAQRVLLAVGVLPAGRTRLATGVRFSAGALVAAVGVLLDAVGPDDDALL